MATRYMVQGDTAPPAATTLEVDGVAQDLQSASAVKYHLLNSAGEVVVDAAGSIDQVGDGSDGTLGFVSYSWAAADTANPGQFREEWEVTFSDGTVRTFPTRGHNKVLIRGQLA